MANDLVDQGLSVRDVLIPVLPLSNHSKKVILSSVPQFIPNDTFECILLHYGKLMGPIKMISAWFKKKTELKHIMLFRHHMYMILNVESQKSCCKSDIKWERLYDLYPC